MPSNLLTSATLLPRPPHTGDVVAPVGMRQYPPDACNTLYVEGLPGEWSVPRQAGLCAACSLLPGWLSHSLACSRTANSPW